MPYLIMYSGILGTLTYCAIYSNHAGAHDVALMYLKDAAAVRYDDTPYIIRNNHCCGAISAWFCVVISPHTLKLDVDVVLDLRTRLAVTSPR